MVAPTAVAWIPSCAGLPKSAPSARPFSAFCANTPVSSAPTVPPTPCAATTSSESSSEVFARDDQSEVARHRGDRAERDGAHRADETGGRRHRDQADDDGGRAADGGRFAPSACSRAASRRPACPSGARNVVMNASAGNRARAERAAGVEAEPAEPEQAGAEQRERHVVRQQRRAADSPSACRRPSPRRARPRRR